MNEINRSLPLGTVVHNRYRITEVLGSGGFGVTYKVTDMKENVVSAMKEYFPADIARRQKGTAAVLPNEGSEDQFVRFRDRFLEEARVIYQFRGHPNIVRVLHLFYENNTAYYVMEYVRGTDLEKLLSKNGNRLPWSALRPIISQVATALSVVHKNGLVHCDISPDNIFILDGGQVKLIDFGAVKNVHRAKSSIVFLKRGYAPPEQLFAEQPLSAKTDIYALGVTVYRAITGTLPPNSSDRLTNDTTVWPSEMGIGIPSHEWELSLKRAMALSPNDRFSDVNEFWRNISSETKAESYAPTQPAVFLYGTAGIFQGRSFPVTSEVIFGTDPTRVNVSFPKGTPGVSRVHMKLFSDGGSLCVIDMGSTYGTYIDGKRLTPGCAYPLSPSSVLYLGDGQTFRAVYPESR